MKLRVFISSNVEEFGPEDKPDSIRRKVAAILREFNAEPVMWEDFLKPAGMTPKEFYTQHLQDCQLYIGILGMKESQGTADEYRESKILRLERWIFIYSPTTATLQNHQTQALANQARSEIVYVKFASEEQLLRQIRDKLKEFLPEKVTEYIELTKKRAQEFLVDYRKSFLEPLLQQILLIRRQLQKDSDLSYSDYWSPENVRNSPYFYIDESLQNELENFFSSFQKCQLLTAEARRAYGENCKQIVEFHINSYIDRLDSDAKGRASQNIEQSLHQTCLMNVINPDKLSNEERERIRMQLGRVISSELDKPYIQASDRWAYIITQIIDGLIKLNQLGNTIRNYLEARKQVETAASNAYETLWKRFLESAGVDRIGG